MWILHVISCIYLFMQHEQHQAISYGNYCNTLISNSIYIGVYIYVRNKLTMLEIFRCAIVTSTYVKLLSTLEPTAYW